MPSTTGRNNPKPHRSKKNLSETNEANNLNATEILRPISVNPIQAEPFKWSLDVPYADNPDISYINQPGPVALEARTLLGIHKVLLLAGKDHELDAFLRERPTYVAVSPDLMNVLKTHLSRTKLSKLKPAVDDIVKPKGETIDPWPHDIDP